jgi:hypothetical protein
VGDSPVWKEKRKRNWEPPIKNQRKREKGNQSIEPSKFRGIG